MEVCRLDQTQIRGNHISGIQNHNISGHQIFCRHRRIRTLHTPSKLEPDASTGRVKLDRTHSRSSAGRMGR